MEIDYAFLAEAAEKSSDGKLYLMGADFKRIAGQYPLVMRSMVLVVKVVMSPEETGKQYHLSAEFRSPQAEKMEPSIELDFTPPVINHPDHLGALTCLLSLQGFSFPTPGRYTVHIFIDGQEKRSFRLNAEEIPGRNATPLSVG